MQFIELSDHYGVGFCLLQLIVAEVEEGSEELVKVVEDGDGG